MKIPPSYLRDAELVYGLVQHHLLTAAEPPAFRLAPREIAVAAGLETLGSRMAKNDSARKLVTTLLAATGNRATYMMLSIALKLCNVSVEHVALHELGLEVPES